MEIHMKDRNNETQDTKGRIAFEQSTQIIGGLNWMNVFVI